MEYGTEVGGTPGNFNRSKMTADKLCDVNAAVQVVSSFNVGEKPAWS